MFRMLLYPLFSTGGSEHLPEMNSTTAIDFTTRGTRLGALFECMEGVRMELEAAEPRDAGGRDLEYWRAVEGLQGGKIGSRARL
jgi:hypothetical protein